ncbi:hypothetical protein NQ318_011662 [Aromia moschata]|uniref:Peptidase M14 domain-containing protein n=1 Tax=Aromia moschata TaxID=1265417 RepID=A0AAV8Y1G9_9CUCU|nr:hypothetical protein NQ318_011662 [Aromia moschata]
MCVLCGTQGNPFSYYNVFISVPDSKVKSLQASLFPPQLTSSGSYFSTFFIKTQTSEEDNSKCLVSESFKDWLSINKDVDFTLQAPRWPTECQVVEERVKHLIDIPPSFEPFYVPTGNECQPKPTGDECGLIVYQYTPISAVNYFSRSSTGGSKYLLSADLCPEEDTLKFESRFESGNLERAIMVTPNFYELHLRADLYTNRHMQWFYFKIMNTKKRMFVQESIFVKYLAFSITNCSKENSLFNEGMKPLMYSTKDSCLHSIGWRRCGQNITYYCNENAIPEDTDQQMTYTLSFTVKFPHDDDEVYLAHSYPYTYSDLQDYLSELSSHPIKSSFSTVRLLCKSLAGNNVYYVTITSPAVDGETKKKRAIVITARVHPGETPSSWIMKGFLDFLTGDSSPAKELRDKFIFKLVPMLNPDGVIVGNNRCSLSAKDLNRQYRTVIRDAYPSIWYTKLMVRRFGIVVLHLESSSMSSIANESSGLEGARCMLNTYLYTNWIGHFKDAPFCKTSKRPRQEATGASVPIDATQKMQQINSRLKAVNLEYTNQKEGTGRVVMWMMGIVNSYTLEASFCGSTLGNRADTHFSTQDYEQMGRSFSQTLLDYYDDNPRKERLRSKIVDRLTKEGSNADEPTNICLSDYSSDEGDTSSSSDEVGKEEEYDIIVIPSVPPSSPVADVAKKLRAKPSRTPETKRQPKSPSVNRKPLPVNK